MSEMTQEATARQEGRLGDPDVELRTDPRLHPGLRATFASFRMDGHAAPPPIDRTAPLEAITELVGASHAFGFFMGLTKEPSNPYMGTLVASTSIEDFSGELVHEYGDTLRRGPLFADTPSDAAGGHAGCPESHVQDAIRLERGFHDIDEHYSMGAGAGAVTALIL